MCLFNGGNKMNTEKITLTTPWGKKITGLYRSGTNDIGVLQSCILHDEYQLEQFSLKPGDVVVDIGAHIGAATLALCSFGVNVTCVEALSNNIEMLKQNIILNEFQDQCIILHRAAAEKDNIDLKVYQMSDATDFTRAHKFIGHVIPRTEEMRGEFEIVKTISLSSIMENIDKCNLLKMDCEGSEWSLLKEVSSKTLNKIDYMIGEAHIVRGWRDDDREIYRLVSKQFDDISPVKNSALFIFKNKNL